MTTIGKINHLPTPPKGVVADEVRPFKTAYEHSVDRFNAMIQRVDELVQKETDLINRHYREYVRPVGFVNRAVEWTDHPVKTSLRYTGRLAKIVAPLAALGYYRARKNSGLAKTAIYRVPLVGDYHIQHDTLHTARTSKYINSKFDVLPENQDLPIDDQIDFYKRHTDYLHSEASEGEAAIRKAEAELKTLEKQVNRYKHPVTDVARWLDNHPKSKIGLVTSGLVGAGVGSYLLGKKLGNRKKVASFSAFIEKIAEEISDVKKLNPKTIQLDTVKLQTIKPKSLKGISEEKSVGSSGKNKIRGVLSRFQNSHPKTYKGLKWGGAGLLLGLAGGEAAYRIRKHRTDKTASYAVDDLVDLVRSFRR